MALLKPNSDHSVSNIRKSLKSGQGYKLTNQMLGNQNIKKRLLKHMGVPMADVEKIREHIAEETHFLAANLKSKKQILQHYRGKWGLNDTNAKKLLNIIAPEGTGPSKEQLAKIKERNLRMKFVADVLGDRANLGSGQTAADKRKEETEKKKQDMLMSHTPGYQKGMAEKSAGNNLVVGPWGGGAQNLTKKGDLEVQHIEGGAGFASGKPKGGVASVVSLEEARKKKLKEKAQDESEHHDFQKPLASGF
jgi:hypothetical protein